MSQNSQCLVSLVPLTMFVTSNGPIVEEATFFSRKKLSYAWTLLNFVFVLFWFFV